MLPCPGRAGLGATLLALLMFAPHAPAQFTWKNPAGGGWSVGTNWDGGTAPTPGVTTTLTFGDVSIANASYTATNDLADPFALNGLTFTNNAGSTVTVAATAPGGGTTFSGVIDGAGALAMAGTGVQTLAGANTYTGNTTVSAGTLRLTGRGSFAASPRITVGTAAGSSAVLDVSGVTGGANFGNGGFALAANQTLAGDGTVVGAVTVAAGAAVAPGASPGKLTINNMTFQAGSGFQVELNGTTAGTTYDQLVIGGTGALDLGSATLSAAFGFTPTPADRLFIIDNQSGGAVTGTFGNAVDGQGRINLGAYFAKVSYVGDFAAMTLIGGNDVVLYAFQPTPEPAHALLLCAAAAAAVRWQRQRGRAVSAVPGLSSPGGRR
jgi:fibronectin-binding autotransporter adhesin